ncbi:delta and Notch-like epidermal growth factor-related receptor isoform X2 [Pomacea canaliculata]|uniref:delta and Notch-like epidermal growth factor-related receptor isoform X2 n=1 Tax=Pomacea canaliculata TaxID=400727 RepID=UPI000D7253FE|nr:delta and Notch-like epidermal growth factor-related receptor isoform X2 [Pomacea canaliculata]
MNLASLLPCLRLFILGAVLIQGVRCDCKQPCQNDGVCFNDTCICSTNYTGSECQIRHPCSSSPCMNGGNCSKRGDKYRCVCPADFSGSHCEWVNRCKSSPCLNAGSCRTWESRYFCICSTAFTGTNCERARSTSPAPTSTRLPHTHTHSSSLVLLAVVAVLLALVVVTTLGWCCWCKVRRRYLGCTRPAGRQDAATRVHIPGFSFSQLLESQGSGEVQGGFYPVWTTPPSYCSLQGDTKPLEFPPPYDELALDAIATPAGGKPLQGAENWVSTR